MLLISTFAFIIEKYYMYEEVAFSQLIQIHENFKYHDLITLEFRRLNSDSVAEVITPQAAHNHFKNEAIYSATW